MGRVFTCPLSYIRDQCAATLNLSGENYSRHSICNRENRKLTRLGQREEKSRKSRSVPSSCAYLFPSNVPDY